MITDKALNQVPGFYEDLSNNPIKSLFKSGNIFDNIVRLKKFFDHTITVDGKFFLNPPGIFVAGIETVEGSHNINEGEIFGYCYTPLVQNLVGLRPLRFDDKTYSIEVINFNTDPVTVSFRIYFYQLLINKK